ncbi:hypothetical protein, partial [Gulbenkiania mobilis]|uniref:hypothetical protein n=1 Tax=Gulbenkiania mobilis TaxID=397457 RepID=UPI00190FCA67
GGWRPARGRVQSGELLQWRRPGRWLPDPAGRRTLAEHQAQKTKLVATINALGADVAALMELENDGYGPQSAIAQLVDALNA